MVQCESKRYQKKKRYIEIERSYYKAAIAQRSVTGVNNLKILDLFLYKIQRFSFSTLEALIISATSIRNSEFLLVLIFQQWGISDHLTCLLVIVYLQIYKSCESLNFWGLIDALLAYLLVKKSALYHILSEKVTLKRRNVAKLLPHSV